MEGRHEGEPPGWMARCGMSARDERDGREPARTKWSHERAAGHAPVPAPRSTCSRSATRSGERGTRLLLRRAGGDPLLDRRDVLGRNAVAVLIGAPVRHPRGHAARFLEDLEDRALRRIAGIDDLETA